MYTAFDTHLDALGVYKLDTVGDAFVVVAGLDGFKSKEASGRRGGTVGEGEERRGKGNEGEGKKCAPLESMMYVLADNIPMVITFRTSEYQNLRIGKPIA